MDEINITSNILVIDDEQSTLKMLRLLLQAFGYTVLTAESGEKGIAVFRKEAPPIVLTDVRMPGMDGIEVLKQLKQVDADVEVIVITGHGDMEMAIQALQLEASDFINKPVQRQALEVALRRAREKIRLKKQLFEYTNNLEAMVEQATAELAKSCRMLKTLCEVTQSLGEMSSLNAIVELLQSKIASVTSLGCRALLVLNGKKDSILSHLYDQGAVGIGEDLMDAVKDLKRPRTLSPAEATRIFAQPPEEPAGGKIVLLPIMREGEPPVGAALITIPREGTEDELRLASLLLSQAAGAIRRAVLQEEELKALRRIVGIQESFGSLIGMHEKMRQVYKLIGHIAESDATVLIQGESGTGKELVARRIHELSRRNAAPFVVMNCAAFPETLLESELFGHEKGAFTGAIHAKRGSFELANGGTIFLDEIGEISLTAQVKLLRVLQFREFQRVGGETGIKVNVRILAATSRNLRRELELGNFREDLYYRLHVIPVTMPPLRQRMSDLPLLAAHFLCTLNERSSKKVRDIGPDAMNILMNHRWPGNIRELENVMEHAFILAGGNSIQARDLPAYLREAGKRAPTAGDGLEEIERQHLIRVLDECRGNKIQAARRLKISRSTLYRKLEHHKLAE